jgi:hypothetical protein
LGGAARIAGGRPLWWISGSIVAAGTGVLPT